MKRAALTVALVVTSFSAQAAGLKELLEAAEKNNVDRRISRELRRKSAAEFNQAWSAMLPSLAAQGSWTHNQYPVEVGIFPGQPKLVITPRNQLDGILRAELPLIDTGRWFRAAAASAMADAAEERDEAMADAVKRQVATTYYGLAAALAVRASAKRSMAVSAEQLRLQEIRSNVGTATELEVLRAKAEVERAKQTVADTEALVANTQRALRTLTGVDGVDSASLPADDLKGEGALADLEARSQELPAVRASEKELLAASRGFTAYKLALVPMVTAHFTERFTNATAFAGQARSYTTGLGLVWRVDTPYFFGLSAQSAQASIARLGLERQRLAARDQVHTDWQRLNAAIEKVTAAQAQVQAAERAAQVARDRYAAGAATQIEVIQSDRDLFGAEVNQIQARTELASSHVALRLSAGLPLEVN
jgi:outer membrane protein TolC